MFDNIFMMEKPLMQSIITTLNDIEVKGKDNMDRLLGVIMVLERAMNAPKPTENEEEQTIEEITDNGR